MKNQKDLIPQFKQEKKQPLNREERFFNSRINKIQELKENIAKAKQILEEIQTIGQTEFIPIANKVFEEKKRYLKILDKYHSLGKYFRKKEKEKMVIIILEEIDGFPVIEEEIELLQKKYNLIAYGTEDPDFGSDEEELEENPFAGGPMGGLFDEIFKMMNGAQEEAEEESSPEKESKKKTANQLKKEEKQKIEAQKLSKTSRTLYTELVKVLHPDREQDEEVKEQKTEIMKRVTQAYEKDDYFELMRLQLEYLEGIGGKDLHQISKDNLKYYNKILLEQKKALEEEWEMMTNPFSPMGGVIKEAIKNPSFLKYKAKRDKQELLNELKGVKHNNDLFEQDKKNLREYLKYIDTDDDFEEMDFEDLLAQILRR